MSPQLPVDNSKTSNQALTPHYDWQVHEHVAETAKAKAQELVETVGSVGLAKQAVEAVGEAVDTIAREEKSNGLLHETLGFASREELERASTAVESSDGKNWFLTELPESAWAVWNTQELRVERHFTNREEALKSVPKPEPLTGTAMLG